MTMSERRLIYPSVLESSVRFLDDLEAWLNRHEVPREEGRSIALVLSEAFNNALLHGNNRNPDKTITVTLRFNESEITADIVDQGQGGKEKVKSRKKLGLLADHGRGIELMERFAASAAFTEVPDGGLKVTMTFRLQPGREATK